MTNTNLEDNIRLRDALLARYQCATVADLKKTAEWAAAFQRVLTRTKKHGVGATPRDITVLQEMDRVVLDNISVPAFFLRTDNPRTFNKREKVWEHRGVGPLVLFEDGAVRHIANGQTFTHPPLTPVVVSGVRVSERISTSERDVTLDKQKSKVVDQRHDRPVPEVSLTNVIQRALEVPDSKSEKARFVIRARTNEDHIVALLTITEDHGSIRYTPGEKNKFKPGVDELKVVATDSAGNPVSLKLPLEQVREEFGISDTAHPKEYGERLAGHRVFVKGKYDPTVSREADTFATGAAESLVRELTEGGMLVNVTTRPGAAPKHMLTFRNSWLPATVDEDGNEVPAKRHTFVELQGKDGRTWRIFDVEERSPGSFHFYTLAADDNKPPRIDVTEHHFTYKTGDRAGQPGVMNEGAFIVFLDNTPVGQDQKALDDMERQLGLGAFAE